MSAGEALSPGETTPSFMVEWHPCPSLPLFADHFPGEPIVPAFYQVAYVRALVASRAGFEPSRAVCRSIKFLRPITPGSQVAVRVDGGGAKGATGVSFSFVLEVDGVAVTRGEIALS